MPSDWQHDKVSNEDQLRSLLSVIAESFCKAKWFGIELTFLCGWQFIKCSWWIAFLNCKEECIKESLIVVIGDAFSEIPVFVQYGEQKQQLFYGMCQNDSMRTIFESSHLHRGHPLKCHLSGCIELFKEVLICLNLPTSICSTWNFSSVLLVWLVRNDKQITCEALDWICWTKNVSTNIITISCEYPHVFGSINFSEMSGAKWSRYTNFSAVRLRPTGILFGSYQLSGNYNASMWREHF